MNTEIQQGKRHTRINLRITGAEELKERLSRIEASMRGEAGKAIVGAGALRLEGAVKVNINERFSEKNTGELKDSVSTSVNLGKQAVATVAVNKQYARIQEFGGTIKPVKAKALHWEQDGEHIFAKSVTLPARPYFRPAIEDSEDEIIAAMADAAESYLAGRGAA